MVKRNPSYYSVQVARYINRDELMSVCVHAGTQRIFVALCENVRGRFIKLSARRRKITVPSEGFQQMREVLVALENKLHRYPPARDPAAPYAETTSTGGHDDGKPELIASEKFFKGGRRFYFDILQNGRGRRVRISQTSTHRTTMIMPVNGLPLLREGIDMLLENNPADTPITDPLPLQRMAGSVEKETTLQNSDSVTANVVRRETSVMDQRFVFESGANRRGRYIKITDCSDDLGIAVMLPHCAVPQMIKRLQEVVQDGDPAGAYNTAGNAQA